MLNSLYLLNNELLCFTCSYHDDAIDKEQCTFARKVTI